MNGRWLHFIWNEHGIELEYLPPQSNKKHNLVYFEF